MPRSGKRRKRKCSSISSRRRNSLETLEHSLDLCSLLEVCNFVELLYVHAYISIPWYGTNGTGTIPLIPRYTYLYVYVRIYIFIARGSIWYSSFARKSQSTAFVVIDSPTLPSCSFARYPSTWQVL